MNMLDIDLVKKDMVDTDMVAMDMVDMDLVYQETKKNTSALLDLQLATEPCPFIDK